MKRLAVLVLLAGFGVMVALVAAYGAGEVWQAAARVGWLGLATVLALRLLVIACMGLAWWLLGRGRADAAPGRFVFGRLLRDSAADTLPLSQLGGFVIGARAASMVGVAGSFAAASTVVDVTLELIGQLGYILLGLGLLAWLLPGTAFVLPALGGVLAMLGLVAGFIALQARGAGAVEALGRRLARDWLGRDLGEAGAVQRDIAVLHARRGTAALGALAHLGCWLLNGVETWVTLQLMGLPVALAEALVIDSLLYALRSIAFLVPNALGVQEIGFILFGGMFGVSADAALALSLLRRARDLAIGVPVLLLWQVIEGRRAFGRR